MWTIGHRGRHRRGGALVRSRSRGMKRDGMGHEWRSGERQKLRALLIRATAAAGRRPDFGELERLVTAGPLAALPVAAGLHRVSGTVLRGLDGVDAVPESVRTALEMKRRQSSFRHLLVIGALSHIRREFDAAGVSWLVMKGPVVAGLLYPDV